MTTRGAASSPSTKGAASQARPSRFCGAGLMLTFSIAALAAMLTFSIAALAACIVVPQTRSVYDPDCKAMTRQVTLETAVIGGFTSCSGEGCAAMLATLGFVTAASVVVSGSIAVVGNAVYWIERQGNCAKTRAEAEAVAASAAARDTARQPSPGSAAK